MVNFRLHRLAGILIGFWLFNLSLTGFFLNHEKNNFDMGFMWSITLPSDIFNDYAISHHGHREITGYKIHPEKDWKALASMRGLFIDRGYGFKRVYTGRVFQIEPARDRDFRENFDTLYLATDRGVIKIDWEGKYSVAGLYGKVITSISVYGDRIVAVDMKKDVYMLKDGKWEYIELPSEADIPPDVRFGRFVRDFHYGRGLFVNPVSMLINDFASLWWLWLSVSGYVIYLTYKKLKKKKAAGIQIRKLVKLHGNIISIVLIPILFLLALTGLFIDHPRFFRPFISFSIPTAVMPPVYHEPQKDIWGVDYDGKFIRIGTRHGLYRVEDSRLVLESPGFAYRVIRVENRLYISGMGSPSRFYSDGKWQRIKGHVHMPVDFIKTDKGVEPVNRRKLDFRPDTLPLYTFFVTLHDGSFFHEYFIYLNDLSVVLTFVLLYTGTIRYLKRRGILR
ncbi:MAG: PepSY domain-containing protein [Aquificae bacterium]|nr:PepSY domain-containing protein [Aquificota bacterium]